MNIATYYYFFDGVDIVKYERVYEVYTADKHLLTTSLVLPTYEYCKKLIEKYYKDRNEIVNKFGNENRDIAWKVIQFLEREGIGANKEEVIRSVLERKAECQ